MRRRKFISERNYKKRKIRILIRYFLTIGVLFAFVYLMRQPYFLINSISISGQESITEKEINESVNNYLDQMWLGIIPRRNILFMGEKRLVNYLIENFSKIHSLDVESDINHLSFKITERVPFMLWCVKREYKSVFDQECYFSDQFGYLYARSPYLSNGVFLKVFVEPKHGTLQTGHQFIEEEEFIELATFIETLNRDFRIDIQMIELKEHGDRIAYINRLENFLFSIKPALHFNSNNPYEESYRNISVVLNEEEFIQDYKNKKDNLKSIDVRFSDRIYYLFNS